MDSYLFLKGGLDGMKPPKLILKIDSREQKPLEFREGIFDEIVTEGLPVGDYWAELEGKELPLCFERKSLGDLFGTMTHGYERWKNMMDKASQLGLTVILLIEGSLQDIFKGYKHSQFSGESMLKKLAMLRVKHDLEWHCFNNRREMARFIEEFFDAVRRNFSRNEGK